MIASGATKIAFQDEINRIQGLYDPAEKWSTYFPAVWDWDDIIDGVNDNYDALVAHYGGNSSHIDYTMNGKQIRDKINANNLSLNGTVFNDGITMFSKQTGTLNQISIQFTLMNGALVYIDWGEGGVQQVSGIMTSNYSTNNFTHIIKLTGELNKITGIYIATQHSLVLNIDYLAKCTNLLMLDLTDLTDGTECTGSIDNLPETLTRCYLHYYGLLNVYGSKIPPNVQYFYVNGIYRLVLNLNDLPVSCNKCYILHTTTPVVGNIDNLPPGLLEIYLLNCGTLVTGSINNMPSSMIFIYFWNLPLITGSIDTFSTFDNLRYLWIYGGQLTGSINSLPAQLESLNIQSAGHFSGDLGNLPALVHASNPGNYFVMPCLIIYDANSTITYGGGALPEWLLTYDAMISCGLTSAEVDDFIIKWALTAAIQESARVMNISTVSGGNNGARTSASNAAVATLAGKNITIT